ncbi:MAG: PIN domain-containing protein [Verrucomicrobiota bacterium]|jgi:tRNA(fMet)-specific endonuclease VapC
MAIILDADVIIRGEKGTFDLQRWVASRPDEEFEVAAITVAELWHGVERAAGARRAERQQYLQTVFAALPVIPYTEQTAYEHARLWAEHESSGKMIGYYDLIVAATALERGSKVATFNQRHFAQVKGLTVIEPK